MLAARVRSCRTRPEGGAPCSPQALTGVLGLPVPLGVRTRCTRCCLSRLLPAVLLQRTPSRGGVRRAGPPRGGSCSASKHGSGPSLGPIPRAGPRAGASEWLGSGARRVERPCQASALGTSRQLTSSGLIPPGLCMALSGRGSFPTASPWEPAPKPLISPYRGTWVIACAPKPQPRRGAAQARRAAAAPGGARGTHVTGAPSAHYTGGHIPPDPKK